MEGVIIIHPEQLVGPVGQAVREIKEVAVTTVVAKFSLAVVEVAPEALVLPGQALGLVQEEQPFLYHRHNCPVTIPPFTYVAAAVEAVKPSMLPRPRQRQAVLLGERFQEVEARMSSTMVLRVHR